MLITSRQKPVPPLDPLPREPCVSRKEPWLYHSFTHGPRPTLPGLKWKVRDYIKMSPFSLGLGATDCEKTLSAFQKQDETREQESLSRKQHAASRLPTF